MKTLLVLSVISIVSTAIGQEAYFTFDGEFRDGRQIEGELGLLPGTVTIQMMIDPEPEGGITAFFYNTEFIRFDIQSIEGVDSVSGNDWDGDVGGSINLVGVELVEFGTQTEIEIGTIVLWDDVADFSGAAEITSWQTRFVKVPEPGSIAAGFVGMLLCLGAYIVRHR